MIGLILGLWLLAGLHLAGWGLPGRDQLVRLEMTDPGRLASVIRESDAALSERRRTSLVAPRVDNPQDCADYGSTPGNRARLVRRYLLFTEDPDEASTLMALAAMNPGELDFDPRLYIYGGAFIYPAGGLLAGGMLVGYLPPGGGLAHYLGQPDDAGRVYRLLRSMVLLAVALAGWLLALRVRPAGAGWQIVALLLFLASPAVATWAVDAKPHAYGLVFVVAAWETSRRLLGAPGNGLAAAAGVLAGLATGSILIYGAALLMPLSAIAAAPGRQEPWHRVRLGVISITSAALAFAATNPWFVIAPARVLAELEHSRTLYPEPLSAATVVPGVLYMVFVCLAGATGPVLVLMAVAGLVTKLARDPRAALVATPAALVYAVIIGHRLRTTGYEDTMRFALFLVPFAVVAAIHALTVLACRSRGAALALTAVLAGTGLARSLPVVLAYHREAGGRCTMDRAGRWILDHVPSGASLGTRWDPAPFNFPALPLGRYRILKLEPARAATCRPDYWVSIRDEAPPPDYDPVAEFVERSAFGTLGTAVHAQNPVRIAVRGPGPAGL